MTWGFTAGQAIWPYFRFGSPAALATAHAEGRLSALQRTFEAVLPTGSSVPEAVIRACCREWSSLTERGLSALSE